MSAHHDLFSLEGRRALITGSSQGIGFALAQGLRSAEAEIVLNGRDASRLESAAARLGEDRAAGTPAIRTLGFDATDHEAVRAAIDGFEAGIGPIDIVINNAGMQHRTPLEDFPADAFERLLQTNIATVFHVGQACARYMIRRGRGKIINIASVQTALAPAGHSALHGDQGRRREPYEGHGDRLGPVRAAVQRDCARLLRHSR